MKKTVIFGAASTGEHIYKKLKGKAEIIYFTDNNEEKWGGFIDDVPIMPTSELHKQNFDLVYIASMPGLEIIYEQLRNVFHIPENMIIRKEIELPVMARVQFLESFAEHIYAKNITGAVCEVGVFQGDFAKEINRTFPDRTCYLFDTFEGFDERDIVIEQEKQYTSANTRHLANTSVDIVLGKLSHPQNCVIKKGYFPETFDILNETFCFVNLDTDLYQPIKDGLNTFYPLMSRGGVILVHDYFNDYYKGVKKAVDEFAVEQNIAILPIGDGCSIAILKN